MQVCNTVTRLLYCVLWLGLNACSPAKWDKTLPPASTLLSQRGYQLVRASSHLHSPISYDACSSLGADVCLQNLRDAICSNRLDFVGLTDHPDHMASNEFPALLLFQPQSGDKLTLQNGNPIANTIQCPNSHTATVTAGFESNLMAIGMTQHLDPSISVRQNLYTAQTAAFVTQLQQDAGAIVVMPHTEAKGKTVATLKDLNLDGIEIYNLHANINPKARANDLGFTYFKGLMDLLVYWIDPFGDQQPDLAFLSFLQVSDVYAKKWDRLIAQGQHVTGLAGNDGHQALFPGNASDGDKIDSFRRTTRWVTQHYLVPDLTLTSMKSAIKNGRGWVVFEGLGSPSGFDFNGTNPVPTTADMGDTLSLAQGTITLHVASPSLNKQSPQDKQSPAIRLNLIYVDSNGSETIVATSQSGGIDYVATQAGAYRVEVWITPLHLTSFIGYKKELAQKAFKWIITNHIYVSS